MGPLRGTAGARASDQGDAAPAIPLSVPSLTCDGDRAERFCPSQRPVGRRARAASDTVPRRRPIFPPVPVRAIMRAMLSDRKVGGRMSYLIGGGQLVAGIAILVAWWLVLSLVGRRNAGKPMTTSGFIFYTPIFLIWMTAGAILIARGISGG